MSFFNKENTGQDIIYTDTLQYRRVDIIQKRTFFSLLNAKALLTVEAALIIPFFLFFILGISSVLLILGLQVSIQTELENTARTLGQKAYYLEKTSTSGAGMNPVSVRSMVLSETLKETVNNSNVEGGTQGLSFAFTTYDSETGIFDIVVTYRYKIPFLPTAVSSLCFTQRCRCHVWTGRDLDTAGEDGEEAEGKTVFVTETGTVYHLTKDCTYLDLSITPVDIGVVSGMRNRGGAKYYPCPLCVKGISEGTVYITDYGTNYHESLSCSGLKRTIYEVDISEVGDMPACSKCGGKK